MQNIRFREQRIGAISRSRWKGIPAILPILVAIFATSANAQFGDYFGFGKNKVHYKSFDWQILKTEHFDVYFYEEERQAAHDAAEISERSYAYLSEILDYKFKRKIPLILYSSHNDFQQTNTVGYIGDGTQGVTTLTQSLKLRVILPITGSYGQFTHVLTHEMVHAFQFEIMTADGPGDLVRRFSPPLWFVEGMAEYLSVGMDNITRMWMRDAVLNNTLLSIPDMGFVFDIRVYRMGQAIWYYVGERYGKEVVGRIFKTARATGDLNRAFKAHTGLDLVELTKRWHEDSRSRYLPDKVVLKKPGEIAKPIVDPCDDCTRLNIVPALSPDGEQLAYVGDENYSLNILLRELEGDKDLHKVVRQGSSQSYESLRYFDTTMNWSPDGKQFSFVAKAGKNDAIYIVDAEKRKVVNQLHFEHLTGMAAPSWSPTGDEMVFTSLQGGISNLYMTNKDGGNLRKLTDNRYAHLHPQWSPDGRKIAFTTDRGPNTDIDNLIFGNYNIALYDVATGEIELMTETGGNHINPVWSMDGKELYFISDMNGIPNVYSVDLESRQFYQITNLITGVSGIITESPAITVASQTGRIAFSAFWNSGWYIYTLDEYEKKPILPNAVLATARPEPAEQAEENAIERDLEEAELSSQTGEAGQAQELSQVLEDLEDPNDKYLTYNKPDSSEFLMADYKPKLTPDLVVGDGAFATNVGFAGQTAFLFSDMLGNRNLLIQAALYGDPLESTLIATYFNQAHRINWALSGFQYRDDFGFFTASTSAQFRSQIFRGAGVSASYPFNTFTRAEVSTNLYFVDDDVVNFSYYTGAVFQQDVGNYMAASTSASLIRDTSFWGLAAPISGTRARFSIQRNFGDLDYTFGLADYRKYFAISVPRYSIAYRLSGALTEGSLTRYLRIGGPYNYRGAEWGALWGTRAVFQNLEFRFPMFPFLPMQFDFLTLVAFADAANVWGPNGEAVDVYARDQNGEYIRDNNGLLIVIGREPVEVPFDIDDTLTSYGFGIRFNLGGLLVLRWDFPIKHQENGSGVFFSIGLDY